MLPNLLARDVIATTILQNINTYDQSLKHTANKAWTKEIDNKPKNITDKQSWQYVDDLMHIKRAIKKALKIMSDTNLADVIGTEKQGYTPAFTKSDFLHVRKQLDYITELKDQDFDTENAQERFLNLCRATDTYYKVAMLIGEGIIQDTLNRDEVKDTLDAIFSDDE